MIIAPRGSWKLVGCCPGIIQKKAHISDMAEKLKEHADYQLVPVSFGPSKAVVPYKGVRSAAEVKHGIVHFSTHIAPLLPHTDLNIPPSNWLRSSSKLEQHVRDLTWQSARKPSQFTSIEMAHKSPELAGEVDVITHASNIKKLLKIPFEKSHVSMMVHRVGKSVLLDEFDMHKHLLRKEQTEWAWLKQFYYESVRRDLHENMKCVPRENKSRDNLHNQNMYSKFLYHSLVDSAESEVRMVDRRLMYQDDKSIIPDPLPEPMESKTHRDVLWTFEDIKMLIGTDLPVFCADSYGVSLRLRDMRTPINVLTGLDYWLDNLMCNVPEVAMCFHVDGIVQKYEIVKTEEIPQLENSRFDPHVVTDIAKNILSFLKTNATKEGHTYWLYKGTNDDVVKLYDLTALCSDLHQSEDQNPFTVPLGMLLYRVARNMWTDQTPGKAALIKTLLENCLYLLDETKHSQVYTSATYLLSDIYVPDSSLDDEWAYPGESSSSENSDEENGQETDDSGENVSTLDVKSLPKPGNPTLGVEKMRLKPLVSDIKLRCSEATKNIYRGLMCLEADLKCPPKKSHIVEKQRRCNSDEAIPLHYEPLHKPTTNVDSENKTNDPKFSEHTVESRGQAYELQKVGSDSVPKGQSWHVLSKGLLFRKAAMVFSALSKKCLNDSSYADAFKYVKLAVYCFEAMKCVIPHKASENDYLLSALLGTCADAILVLTKSKCSVVDWDSMFGTCPDKELGILAMAEQAVDTFEYEHLFTLSSTDLDNLQACVKCYDRALGLVSKKNGLVFLSLMKRKGNALNELGVCYMHRAQTLLESEDFGAQPSDEMQGLWLKGRERFTLGLEVFEEVEDKANQALLHCNYGRLMRLCATTYTRIAMKTEKQEFTPNERYYFRLAIDEYKKALKLGNQGFKEIVESIRWELSSTYFSMASLLQDYAPLSTATKEEIENEVAILFDSSMKYCREESSQPVYQFRIATINHRLASLLHNTVRGDCSEHKKKHLRQLSEKHYMKALKSYQQMECHIEFLRAQLEYVALLEQGLTGHSNMRAQKILLQVLKCLAECGLPLKCYMESVTDTADKERLLQEAETVTRIIQERLESSLEQLIKMFSVPSKKGASKDKSDRFARLKSLRTSLLELKKRDIQSTTSGLLQKKCELLGKLLAQVLEFCHTLDHQADSTPVT